MRKIQRQLRKLSGRVDDLRTDSYSYGRRLTRIEKLLNIKTALPEYRYKTILQQLDERVQEIEKKLARDTFMGRISHVDISKLKEMKYKVYDENDIRVI